MVGGAGGVPPPRHQPEARPKAERRAIPRPRELVKQAKAKEYPEISRRLNREEKRRAFELVEEFGLRNAMVG